MAFNKTQFLEEIVRPCLTAMDAWSYPAENLILGTCAQESGFGTYLRQLDKGPALGIFQMEPATFTDIWSNYLNYRESLSDKILSFCSISSVPEPEDMIYNLRFATCMTRVHYLRVPFSLPKSGDDVELLALYWKKHYNTSLGKGTESEFIHNYERYVSRGT